MEPLETERRVSKDETIDSVVWGGRPFQAALLSEAGADSVCAAAQSAAAANVTAFRVRADRPSSLIGFELADVSTDAAKRTVTVVDYPRPPRGTRRASPCSHTNF